MLSIVRATSLALFGLATLAGVAAAQGGAPKFAYINSQVLIAQAPGRAEADAAFQRDMTSFQQQVQRMGDSLRTLIEAYEKEQISLSPAAKETRQQAIRKKEEEFQTRTSQLEQQAQQRRMELVQPIMDRINRIIEDIRNEEGYTMIFDAGSAAGVVVAADKNLDITDKVLARLRATASTARPAPTPASNKPTGAPVSTPSGVTRPKPNQ